MVVQDVRGPYVVIDGPWLAVLGVFVVVSIQVGRRTWVDRLSWHIAEEKAWQFGWDAAGGAGDVDPDTITYQGSQACVLEVRDARGRAIPSAYVWDVTGDRPLPMNNENC